MPSHPWLADYGGFAGDFLECVSTYVHAVRTDARFLIFVCFWNV